MVLQTTGLISKFSVQYPEFASGDGPLAELQKLYFDIALSARPETLAPLMELVSIKNVLFGSDFPFANRGASLEENLEGFYKYGFTDEQLRAVERGNAELLLPNFALRGR